MLTYFIFIKKAEPPMMMTVRQTTIEWHKCNCGFVYLCRLISVQQSVSVCMSHVFHLILFVMNLITIDTGIESMKSIECDTAIWILVSYELLKRLLALSIRHQVQTTWTLLVDIVDIVVLIGTSIQGNVDYKKSTRQTTNLDDIILELDISIYVAMQRCAKIYVSIKISIVTF